MKKALSLLLICLLLPFFPNASAAPVQVSDELALSYQVSMAMKDGAAKLSAVSNKSMDMTLVLDLVSVNHPGNWGVSWTETPTTSIFYDTIFTHALEDKDAIVKSKVDAIVAEYIDDSMTPREKAVVLHDYLVQNCEYDASRTNVSRAPFTAYGALIEKRAVCSGYADAFMMLANAAGLSVVRCSGTSKSPGTQEVGLHMWNLIYLDGVWLHVDVTWDDPLPDRGKAVRHDYLFLTSEQIGDTHHWNAKIFEYLPLIQPEAQAIAQLLHEQKKFMGTAKGFELTRSPTRAEAAVLLVRLLGAEEEALAQGNPHGFSDVPEWASPYVGYLYQNGFTKGVSSTAYGSTNPVTLPQFLTFLFRARGVEPKDALRQAREMGWIDDGFVSAVSYRGFTRGDAVLLMHRTTG